MSILGSFVQFAALLLAGQTTALAFPSATHLYRRDAFDVNIFAYLGDSFAAGPGAGAAYDSLTSCRRTKEAWGPQVANDMKLQGQKPLKNFDFIACSGAKTKHIFKGGDGVEIGSGDGQPKEAQASLLKDTNPDLVTLSIGGNDVGFTDLLDRVRVFQWCVYV